ncbi:MAG: [FeFe] hydrogenase H-cluster radical SAM maturase HydE [Anaerovoracaceae bacterium]
MDKQEIIKALSAEDFSPYYEEADRLCRLHKGNIIDMRAIIEFSNVCARGCTYCGLNVNCNVERYQMSEEEIKETALKAIAAGYKTIVLQSGEVPNTNVLTLGRVSALIKAKGAAITISCGELSREELVYLKEQGADRYLLKHETADEELYRRLHPDGTLTNRLNTLRDIKALGYETGSGFMVGLPGQTVETLAEDLLLLKEIGCDMAGIGPFIASPNTPLAGEKNGDPEMTKRAVAIARILLPKANLPVTTSLGVLSDAERRKAFSCGANVIMKKVTPDEYKDKYKIYPADIPPINIEKDRADIIKMLAEIGKKGV